MPEIELISITTAILLVTAYCAGLIDAIAGGGGMLTVPAFLFAGIPPHVALGTNKLCSSFGSLTATIIYRRRNLFRFSDWKWHVLSTSVGAIVGTFLVEILPVEYLYNLIPAAIFGVAIFSMLHRFTDSTSLADKPRTVKKAWLHGILLGGYDGLIGPGTGSFWTLSLRKFYGLTLLSAIGATKLMNFTSNATSMLVFFYLGHINIWLGASMGLVLMAGSYTGARLTIKLPTRLIAILFNLIVMAMAVKLAIEYWL